MPAPRPAQQPLPFVMAQIEPLVTAHDFDEAAAILEEAAQDFPESPRPLVRLGQIYLNQQRWLLAEDAFNRALARDLDNPVALTGLAETLFNQQRYYDALRIWQELISVQPRFPGAFTGLGRTQLQLFDFDAAKEAFLAQLENQPDPEARWYLAAMEAPTDPSVARDYLEAIPPASPQAVERASRRGLLARRDYLLAVLEPFSEETPQNEVAEATGIALTQLQLWPLAVQALTIAQEKSPSPVEEAEALAFLGYALAQAGRPAVDVFERAHALDPDSALPLYFEGLYLRDQGALDAAEDLLVEAARLEPENAAIYVELAEIKAAQGSLSAAEALYQVAIDVSAEELPFQMLLAQFYANRAYRLTEAGIPTATAIIETDDGNAEAHDLLGWMQFLTDTEDGGLAALQRALELNPELVSAHYHLARYLEARGQTRRAQAEYEWVIERDTTGVFRDQAWQGLQRLRVE